MTEYINRKDAINGFVQMLKQSGDIYPTDITTMLQSIPPADVLPVVRGKWEHPSLGYDYYRCSVCGYEHRWPLPFNFCPNCGADMRKQEEMPKKDPFEGWSEELKETYRKLLASLHLEGGDAE